MKKAKAKKRIMDEGPKVVTTKGFAAMIVKSDDRPPKLSIKSERYFLSELNRFRDGEQVTVVVTSQKPKRTEAQNRYYWGCYLPTIARETGEQDLERLHELFKGKFLTTGVVEVLGEKVRLKKSTTELGVGEFCEYIMAIQNETGVEAPPTEDYSLISLEEGIKKHGHEKEE